jgi:hypothetical protein
MAIAPIPPFAKRTTQGVKLSSLQHDNLHEVMRSTINALIEEINTLQSSTSPLPAGLSIEWNSNTLPTEFSALWEDGTVVSRALYPRLFAICGTSFNTGGESGSQFRLPNKMGKVVVCANPMNGQTDGALSTRTFATYFGSQSNAYATSVTINTATLSATPTGTVTLSPYTPSGTIAVANFTPTGTIAVTPITPTGTVTVAETLIPYTPTGTIAVTLTDNTLTGTGTVTVGGLSCQNVVFSAEPAISAIDCTVPPTVDAVDIAAALTVNTTIDTQTFTGDATDFDHTHTATFTGSLINLVATFTGASIGTTATFTGSASTQTATFTGVTESLNHSHTVTDGSINVSTMQPAIVKNFIITY